MTSHGSSESPDGREGREARGAGGPLSLDAPVGFDAPAPPGFRVTRRSRVIGHGGAVFRAAGDAVLRFGVHRGSGFVPLEVPDRVEPGVESRWAVTFGPLRPAVACRVIDVARTETSIGFVHAALRGHPQRGFESYVVVRHPDDSVTLDIRVVWRPAAWWMRAAGPFGALALSLILRRNLRALDPVIA